LEKLTNAYKIGKIVFGRIVPGSEAVDESACDAAKLFVGKNVTMMQSLQIGDRLIDAWS
jgi:hypothetical protein